MLLTSLALKKKMSISDVNKCKNSFITSILDHKKSIDDPNDTSNIFNNFLASVGKTSYRKGNPSSESQPLVLPKS